MPFTKSALNYQMKLFLGYFGYVSFVCNQMARNARKAQVNCALYSTIHIAEHGNVIGRTILVSGTAAELEQKAKKTRGPTAYWSTGLPYIMVSKFRIPLAITCHFLPQLYCKEGIFKSPRRVSHISHFCCIYTSFCPAWRNKNAWYSPKSARRLKISPLYRNVLKQPLTH